jgi:hypothetical protein
MTKRSRRLLIWIVLGLVGSVLLLNGMSFVVAESLWFQELGYSDIWFLRLNTRLFLGILATAVSLGFIGWNLYLTQAYQHAANANQVRADSVSLANPRQASGLRLRALLATVLGLGLLLALLLQHVAEAVLENLQPAIELVGQFPGLPAVFTVGTAWRDLFYWGGTIWWWAALALFLLLLILRRVMLLAIAGSRLALIFGLLI